MSARLGMLDEYLAKFDARPELRGESEVAWQPRWPAPRRAEGVYAAGPTAAGSGDDLGAQIADVVDDADADVEEGTPMEVAAAAAAGSMVTVNWVINSEDLSTRKQIELALLDEVRTSRSI